MTNLTIFTDGGSRGNPGPAASAYLVISEDKTVANGFKYLGVATNNAAEYTAVIIALEWLKSKFKDYNVSKVNFMLDSELVVRQLSKIYKIKNPKIKIFYEKITNLMSEIPCEFLFTSVAREKNKEADRLVNEALDKNSANY